jgi:hypothetical protein
MLQVEVRIDDAGRHDGVGRRHHFRVAGMKSVPSTEGSGVVPSVVLH